jgi:hypothetical protein
MSKNLVDSFIIGILPYTTALQCISIEGIKVKSIEQDNNI